MNNQFGFGNQNTPTMDIGTCTDIEQPSVFSENRANSFNLDMKLFEIPTEFVDADVPLKLVRDTAKTNQATTTTIVQPDVATDEEANCSTIEMNLFEIPAEYIDLDSKLKLVIDSKAIEVSTSTNIISTAISTSTELDLMEPIKGFLSTSTSIEDLLRTSFYTFYSDHCWETNFERSLDFEEVREVGDFLENIDNLHFTKFSSKEQLQPVYSKRDLNDLWPSYKLLVTRESDEEHPDTLFENFNSNHHLGFVRYFFRL